MNISPRGYIWLLGLSLSPLLGELRAEVLHDERSGDLDSLLSPIARTYYRPQGIQDSLLQGRSDDAKQRRNARLLEYLRTQPNKSQGEISSFLTTKLLLPLVTAYPQGNRQGYDLPSLQVSEFAYPQRPELQLALPRSWNDLSLGMQLSDNTMRYLQTYHLDRFAYGAEQLMAGREQISIVKQEDRLQEKLEQKISTKASRELLSSLSVTEIERKYWHPHFETSIQFSQNYISDNWYKGGSSNLNLSTRTYLALTYTRGDIVWLNELEDKLSLYNADPADGGKRYRIGEDMLRVRSNFGLKASKRWSYTVDAEMRTQFFTMHNSDRTIVQSAFLSPFSSNVGLGMQFSYSKRGKEVFDPRFSCSLNIAPISYSMRMTRRKDIDLKRHSLTSDKPYYHRFGSTLRMNMQWDFNMDLSWASRLYINTSYSNLEAEWENTLTMRHSRYFSTRINVHLRFDDSATPLAGKGWRKYIQTNELLSFGFNYKL